LCTLDAQSRRLTNRGPSARTPLCAGEFTVPEEFYAPLREELLNAFEGTRLLLDTHIFLWSISGDARLPVDWRNNIRDTEMRFI
jgi:hypothetical protein